MSNIELIEPTEKDVLNGWWRWLNDKEVTKYQNKGVFYNTPEKQFSYLLEMKESSTDVLFGIYFDKKHIGCVALHNIDWINRSAKIGILIGEKSYWNKGIGKKAWNIITQYGLFILNLHRIYADIFEENEASLKVAKASGFKEEGIIRDKYYKNGKYYNAVLLSVLKDEFIEVD